MSEQCNDPLNIRGEGFNCDRTLGHPLPHMSKLAGAIWSDCAAAEAVVLDERARIVAWIRSDSNYPMISADILADSIEHGAHLEES